jgi:hypothetical protein
MTYRLLIAAVLLMLVGAVVQAQTIPPTPDIFASGTAQVLNLTLTAEAPANRDPFVMTATELIRQASATAARQSGAVASATPEAGAVALTPVSVAQSESADQPADEQIDPLSSALLILILMVAVLGGVGYALVVRSHNKRRLR